MFLHVSLSVLSRLHLKNEDILLNILFPDEIVVAVVSRLKADKADRENGLLAEHINVCAILRHHAYLEFHKHI